MLYITISETLKIAGVLKDLSNKDTFDNGSDTFAIFKKDGVWRTPLVDFIGRYDEVEDNESPYDEGWEHEDYDPRIHDRHSEMAEANNVYLADDPDSFYPIPENLESLRGLDLQEDLSPAVLHKQYNYWGQSRKEERSIRRSFGRDCHGPTRNTKEDFEAPKENFPSHKGKFSSWKRSRRTQFHHTK